MKIRKAINTDLEVIAQSYINKLWEAKKEMDGDLVKAVIQDTMDDPAAGMYLIAEDDSEGVVACMSVLRSDDEEHGEVFQEHWHYIEPEYRKSGLLQKMRDYFSGISRK
jgi:hypothetical protein